MISPISSIELVDVGAERVSCPFIISSSLWSTLTNLAQLSAYCCSNQVHHHITFMRVLNVSLRVNQMDKGEFEAKEKEKINPSQSLSLPKPPYLTIA